MAQTYALTILLRDEPGVVERYRAGHAAAWPPVIASLRASGILDMQIFLLGRRLFMWMRTVDGFDPARDLAGAEDDPDCRRWDELMTSLQERAPEAGEGEWWAEMELVFDLAWPQFADGAGDA
jgi:L-rhamnose mutarotase